MLSDLYIDSFIAYRNAEAADGYGGTTLTPSANVTATGRLEPLGGSELILNDRKEVQADYRLYCAVADITEKDYIVISSVTYDIYFVETLNFGNNPHLEVYLRKRI